jgi:hypothetical protein
LTEIKPQASEPEREERPLPSSLRVPDDRRRPNRLPQVSQALVRLLRFKPSPDQVEATRRRAAAGVGDDEADDLRPARGITLCVVVGVLLWLTLVAFLIWVW